MAALQIPKSQLTKKDDCQDGLNSCCSMVLQYLMLQVQPGVEVSAVTLSMGGSKVNYDFSVSLWAEEDATNRQVRAGLVMRSVTLTVIETL